jgi:hypothetical protein
MSLMDTAQLLGNLGEFIGAIVIVATLIYLAMQIRQNSDQLAAQSRYNIYKGRTDLTSLVSKNNEIFEIYLKSRNNDELSQAERLRISFFARSVFTFWEYEFREYEAGRLAEEEFNPGGKRNAFEKIPDLWNFGWAEYKKTDPQRFVDYVDQNIATRSKAG